MLLLAVVRFYLKRPIGGDVATLALNLVALTSLLMVVSMGVDYGVFLVDAASESRTALSAALLSVTVAALSTLAGFGLLALSQHPVLHSIGLTAVVGMSSCLVLAPTALAVAAATHSQQQDTTSVNG